MRNQGNGVFVKPGYIIGAAEVCRELYIREGFMSHKMSLRLTCPKTGMKDIAHPKTDEELLDEKISRVAVQAEEKQIARQKREQKRQSQKWRRKRAT